MMTWSTWEELLLGGAILRHGTGDWTIVAAELKTRTVSPCTFTPQVCKAKYEELQQQYFGCTVEAWVEELRKKRIVELKRSLELSDEVIGSLELNLESLKAERNDKIDDCRINNDSVGPDETMPELSGSTEQQKVLDVDSAHPVYEEPGGNMQRQKRKRKRKRKNFDSNDNEPIVPEDERIKDLIEILDSVLAIEGASVFCRKDDSQMRARYKEMIRIHLDFDIIMSRICDRIINSRFELFRDLLLLTTNALTFYSKTSRKHKIALRLRDFVTGIVREKVEWFSSNVTSSVTSPMLDPLVKVTSMHTGEHKIDTMVADDSSGVNVGDTSKTSFVHDSSVKIRSMRSGDHMVVIKVPRGRSCTEGVSLGDKKASKVESLPMKKTSRKEKMVASESADQTHATPGTRKGRKRGRTK